MKKICVVIVVASLLVLFFQRGRAIDESDLIITELITYGLINVYSTNLLINISYGRGGINKEDALDAISRNNDFVKVLKKYSSMLKSEATEEDETQKYVGKMAHVCDYLELQLDALEEYVDKGTKISSQSFERYRETLEKLIDDMLKKES